MRTTLSIDTPVLDEIKRLQQTEGGSLGRMVTRLLSEALAHRKELPEAPPRLEWISKPMKARVDIADRDAVYAILDEDARAASA
jgi:hypothetical protein